MPDDLTIRATESPWLYASGYTGLREAVLDLVVDRPVVAPRCGQAPVIDGVLNDACWDGRHPLPIADEKGSRDPRIAAFMRSDDKGLYLAFECKAAARDGKPIPWHADLAGEDADVWTDDSWEIFLTDRMRRLYLRLGVSASGARYDAKCTYESRNAIDKSWNGKWVSKTATTSGVWRLEMAVPWQMLASVGLDKDTLRANILGTNLTGVRSREVQLHRPGRIGFRRCDLFRNVSFAEPPEAEAKSYTVRLHFVELDNVKPGQRVFDVKLQNQVVLAGLDIIKETNARNAALVKEFNGVRAGDTLTLELVPQAEASTSTAASVISAMEVYEEESAGGP